MDLEQVEPALPITGRASACDGTGAIGALGLAFDRKWAAKIARREEYDAEKFLELLELAERAEQPIGDFLLEVARRAGFNALSYRRALFEMLGYTSPGYIFHPLPLEDGRVAIVAVGSGYEGSGDPGVPSRRRECGMDRLLSMDDAMRFDGLDDEEQLGYFVECLLGGLHGLEVGDLTAGLERDAAWAAELARRLSHAAAEERHRFLGATSLDEAGYSRLFSPRPHPSLSQLLNPDGLG